MNKDLEKETLGKEKEAVVDEKDIQKSKADKKKEFTINDLPGVGAATAEKLREGGFCDLISVAVASPGQLVEACGVGESVARKMINTAREKAGMGFETGEELLKKRDNLLRISLGSKKLDQLFGGGVESSGITECYGPYGAGKSAIAHQLAVNVQLPKEKGGIDGKALWIDTESSLPFGEKILVEKENRIQLVQIGELIETALNSTENIVRYGNTISTADNFENVKAISYDPEDYKIKTFPITGFIKHPKQKIYEVKLKSGRSVRVTEYHNFFTLDGNCELSEIATKDLSKGTKIAIAGSIPIKMGINVFDLSEMFSDVNGLYVRGGEEFRSFLDTIREDLQSMAVSKNLSTSSLNNWLTRTELPLGVYNKIKFKMNDAIKTKLRIGGWSRKYMMPLLVPTTIDLMKFLGLYVGEGSCLKGRSVIITCTKKDVEYNYVRNFASSLSFVVKRSKNDLKINARPFALFIEKLNLGYSADTKKLPEFILNLGEKYIEAFMEGYIAGDGSRDKITGATTCETKSKELADGLLYATCALGIPARHNTVIRTYKCSEKNGIRPENDGKKYAMQSISWQTFLIGDSRFDELPNDKLQFTIPLLKSIMDNYGSIKSFSIKAGIDNSYLTYRLKRYYPIRKSTLTRWLQYLPDSESILKIKKIINSDIWFDAIESINCVGEEMTYDVEVMPGDKEIQNFIGGHGGIILHNTFRPERIKQIATDVGLDPIITLKNIIVARAFNSDHQMLLAEKAEDFLRQKDKCIKLVIIDSLMSHYRSDFVGRGQLADRQQKLNKHIHTLLKLATSYNIVVYVTNQVMSKPDTFFGDPTEAIGGHVLAHGMTTRVYLRKGKKGTRVAKMVDSPYLPESEAPFMITEQGIKDADI
ncbi:DNA repair and recombination protein RadA [Candidatus Woesearchaeota archaeon]|nr:DNA repair and recombination protein RadA [Candidatus Woesearchaeota archaeon]